MSSKDFPEGLNIGEGPSTVTLKSDPSGGLLSSGPLVQVVPAALQSYFGVTKVVGDTTLRVRTLIATINAGATVILPGFAGYKWRLLDVIMIAVGGATTNVTTVDILGVQSGSSVKLAAFGQAALTQSTVLRPGIAGCTVLADGASFVACDLGQGISLSKTGAGIGGATNIDVILNCNLEA